MSSNSSRASLALVVMPVVNIDRPFISIAKLRSALVAAHGERVSTAIHYLCHDFATWMADGPVLGGLDLHEILLDHQYVGLPDWFFRSVAFPDVEDNAKSYFRRYFPGRSPEVTALRDALLDKRDGLEAFLEGLIDDYELDRHEVVGFTSLFVQSGAVFAMARLLKRRNPAITIVMGGQNCDSPMGEEIARHVPSVDFVFSGPAMVSFPAAVGHLMDGERDALDTLPGVFSARRPEREPGERAGPEDDLDAPVDLDYSEFFESFERRFGGTDARPQVHLETSRGCWWGARSHCTFCGLNGDTMAYRAMAPERAIALFRDLFERYRDKSSIYFAVDNILPTNYVEEVLPYIQAPPGARIFYEIKASMSADELATMADAGVHWIQPGIEALSTTSLRLMKKGTTVFVNLRLLKNCLRLAIDPIWSLLVGFPGEGEEVYAKYVDDLPLVTHLRPPKGVAAIHFDRFSPYFTRAEEYGLALEPVDFYEYCFPFPKAALRNLAYFFTDTHYDAPHYTGLARWMGPMKERVKAWRDRWELDGRDIWEYVGDELEGPRLELRRGGGTLRIFDSRGPDVLEYDLEPDALRLLEFLETDRSVRAIEQHGREQGYDAAAALALLEQHRLVWCEDQRRMGLVMLDPAAGRSRLAGADLV